MFIDPISQFYDGVVPAYNFYVELSKKKDNKKFMLMNAAIQTANMLFHYREKVQSLFPKRKLQVYQLAAECPDYHIIGRVFDKSKHNTLRNPAPLINDDTAIEETSVSTYFPYLDNPDEWYGCTQIRIMINFINGETRDLLEISTNVINYWADFLLANKLTDKHIKFLYEGDDLLTVEQTKELGMSATIQQMEIGNSRMIMIARVFDLELNKFLRLPFSTDGNVLKLIPNPVSNIKQNNLKVEGSFPPEMWDRINFNSQ